MKPSSKSAAADTPPTAEEPRNVAVEVIAFQTKIGKALVGIGRCPFPLTKSEAETLRSLGKVRITGIF